MVLGEVNRVLSAAVKNWLMCRLAAELGILMGRSYFVCEDRKGMENLQRKSLMILPRVLLFWNFSQGVWNNQKRNGQLWVFPLPSAMPECQPQSALSAPSVFPGNWEDPERGGKSESLQLRNK